MKRSIVAALLAAALPLTLAACGSSNGPGASGTGATGGGCTPAHPNLKTVKDGALTVSAYVSAPYARLARAGGDVSGVDGTIITKLAAMECLTVKATPTEGAALISTVQAGRSDLAIGGVYRTEERAKILNLSDTMYRDGMATLSKDGVSTVSGMNGKSIGVIQGYLWNEELQTVFGDKVKIYQDSTSMLQDLQTGRLEVGVLTSAEASVRAKENAGLKPAEFASDPRIKSSTAPGQVVLAITKSETDLTKAFNENLATLLKDGTIASALKAEGMSEKLAGAGS